MKAARAHPRNDALSPGRARPRHTDKSDAQKVNSFARSTHPVSRAALYAELDRLLAGRWSPVSLLPFLEWVQDTLRLPDAKGNPQPFSFCFAPYQKETAEAIFDPRNQEVIFQLFSRGGKTRILLAAIGYCIAQLRRRIVVMWPTQGQGKRWSKDEFSGDLLRWNPDIAGLFRDGEGRRRGSNTTMHKEFLGGILAIVGANVAGDIRREKGSLLYVDECDAIPPYANPEGDPLKILKKRGSEFADVIAVFCSYPSVKGRSRIEAMLAKTDCRQWFVRCLLCDGEPFIMHRTGLDPFNDKFKRSKLLYDPDRPQDARLECPNCRGHLDDTARYRMMMGGDPKNPRFDLWKPTRPFGGKAGFHANSLLWPHPPKPSFPGGYLQELAQEMIDVEHADNPKNAERVLINTCDAETFAHECEAKAAYSTLYLRREDYHPDEMLPAGVLFILAFWDVQKDRVEGEIVGYGLNAQTWGLGYHVIKGSPLVPPNVGVWAEIERIHRMTNFPHPGGRNLHVSGGLVDCGSWKDFVCAFTRPRARLKIFASRGSPSQRGIVGHNAAIERCRLPNDYVLKFARRMISRNEKSVTRVFRHLNALGHLNRRQLERLMPKRMLG